MGFSQDYSNVPDWVSKSEGYQTGAMVKYQGNIFYANFWASEPGVGDADSNGWRFYDELYDVTPHTPTEQAKIIAYIPTWRKKEGFNYTNDEMYQYITHGIVAFLMFSETNLGEFDTNSVNDVNAILSDVVNTGHQNGTKISIALGGATDYGFLNLMTSIGNNPANPLLDKAVQNVANFVNSNNLDGVDLDLECWWGKPGEKDQGGRKKSEGPHPAGYALTLFAQKLKQAIPDKLVSAAVFGTSWYGNNYDSKIADYVDWLGVMTYDLTGSWNTSPVGPHSALFKIRNQESSKIRNQEFYQESYIEEQQGDWPGGGTIDNPILSVEDTLWYWTNPLFVNWQGSGQNIPRTKIAAGVPIYGYDFAYGKDPDELSGQVPPGYKSIRYKDILSQFPDAHQAPNGNIKVSGNTPRPPFISASGSYPYAHNIYFETPDTAVTKLKFLKNVGCQGVIIWELSNDVWEEAKSIIKALYKNSGNHEKSPIVTFPRTRQELPILLELEETQGLLYLSKDVFVRNIDLFNGPAVSVFDNEIYCLYKRKNDHLLWGLTFDGSKWSSNIRFTNNLIETDASTDDMIAYVEIALSESPALVVFNGVLYCFHQGDGYSGELWYTTYDHHGEPWRAKKWSEDKKVPNVGISGSPAVAVFNNKIYCFHEGSRSNQELWYTTFDGSNWENDQKVPNVGISGSPAVAVFNNKIYCFHEGSRSNQELWYTTFDGSNWENDKLIPNVGISGSPSLAVFNNQLYCFHQGSKNNGELWWSRFIFNSITAHEVSNLGLSKSPSVAVFQNKIYCLHQGQGDNGELWYSTFDGSKWLQDQKVSNVGISESPAVLVFNNQLYCFHQGSNNNGELWYSYTKDGVTWEIDTKVPNVGLSKSPSVTVFQNKIYCFYQLAGNGGSLRYITFDGTTFSSATLSGPGTFVGYPSKDGQRFPIGSDQSPAVVVFNNQLYCFHQGSNNNGELWYSYTKDGWTWEIVDTQIPNIGLSKSPSVAVFKDKMYCFHQGMGDNRELWYTIFDGSTWLQDQKVSNVDISESPAVVVFNNKLYCFYQNNNNQLLYSLLNEETNGSPWIEVRGANSYCYCMCNRSNNNHQGYLNHTHTMNIEAGAPYFYAVLTKDDDTVDFPTGAKLEIQDPDGNKYDRDIQEENQLVKMSGDSVRFLIIKDPKPGNWTMTMSAPEGVGFHCECNTVPSKDPYDTITNALSMTNQLQKRGLSDDNQGWIGVAATTAIVSGGVTEATVALDISVTFSIAGATLSLTPFGIFFLAAAIGTAAVTVTLLSSVASTPTRSEPSNQVSEIATGLTNTAQTISTTPLPTPQPQQADDAIQLYLRTESNRQNNEGLGDFEILLQNGSQFTYDSYLQWIVEIRNNARTGNMMAVRLNINGAQSPWIRVNPGNFYITAFSLADNPWTENNWRDIPANLINYGNNSINISFESIRNAMFRVRDWINNPRNRLEEGPLQILIFLSAEAARFDGVAFAVNALLRRQVDSYDWLNFRPLLTNWGSISTQIYHLPPGGLQPGISLYISRSFALQNRYENLVNYLTTLEEWEYPLGFPMAD
ncbi:glycosyl hydrolase, BNR repeat protein (plasmid) [Microchaete diplosiphon NIES-3275]|nr:glycosyl hydrolase, BNR repeat protein [Microchaete diplosiphon NIES-3275]